MVNGKTELITIEVDEETADAYRAASEEDRRKIESLLGRKLRHLVRSQTSLKSYVNYTPTKVGGLPVPSSG